MGKRCLFHTLPLTDTFFSGDRLQSPLNDTAVSLCNCVKQFCQDCHRCTYFLLNCLVQSTLSYVSLASTGTWLCIVYSTCLVNAFKWKDLSEMPTWHMAVQIKCYFQFGEFYAFRKPEVIVWVSWLVPIGGVQISTNTHGRLFSTPG